MKSFRTNQKGFGLVEILVVFLVIAAISAIGFVFYNSNHSSKAETDKSATTDVTPQSTKTDTTQTAQGAQQYLVIKEWGVQLTLDSNTSSLYYYIKPELPDVAYLSPLKTVSDIAPNCAADKVSLMAIGRLTQDEQNAARQEPEHSAPTGNDPYR